MTGGRAPQRRRRPRLFTVATKAFVWIVLIVFVLTSVGVALVTIR